MWQIPKYFFSYSFGYFNLQRSRSFSRKKIAYDQRRDFKVNNSANIQNLNESSDSNFDSENKTNSISPSPSKVTLGTLITGER